MTGIGRRTNKGRGQGQVGSLIERGPDLAYLAYRFYRYAVPSTIDSLPVRRSSPVRRTSVPGDTRPPLQTISLYVEANGDHPSQATTTGNPWSASSSRDMNNPQSPCRALSTDEATSPSVGQRISLPTPHYHNYILKSPPWGYDLRPKQINRMDLVKVYSLS